MDTRQHWIARGVDWWIKTYAANPWRCLAAQLVVFSLGVAAVYEIVGIPTNIGWLLP